MNKKFLVAWLVIFVLYMAGGIVILMIPKHLHDARFPVSEPDHR